MVGRLGKGRRVSRRGMLAGAVGVAAGAVVAGCGRDADAVTETTWAKPSPTPDPIVLTVTPTAGATDVVPSQQVVVSASGGKLQSVTVASGGRNLDGDLDSDGATWRSSGALSYGATYTVTAKLVDSLGDPVEKTSNFTTLKPTNTASVTFQANALSALKAGGTYGVGQPVIVRFSRSVSDRAAAEKAIIIETSPSVDGKFFWLDKQTVHWRPQKYWAKGTEVKVTVNVLGVDLGKGVYGSKNASTHFTIGRSLVAIADNNAHYTKVYVDGKLVRTMACSMGKGGDVTATDGSQITYWTHNGVHVVLGKAQTVNMSSASYGITDKNNPNYYEETVTLCTRISYSGEYLHAAPWNMADHGKRNSSHGCINLSIPDAQWVYDTFIQGDVVEVTNSPRPLGASNGLGDWNVSWDSY